MSYLLSFNGERLDPVTGTTHLGNGYRAYSPVLMRFTCPDSWSPFGGGGMNPYAYCEGDPINRADPSGHMSWQAGLGIGLGILGILGQSLPVELLLRQQGVSVQHWPQLQQSHWLSGPRPWWRM
ncbi:RHS repeat-associated core domain-containing protein [Serratia proteamaculans]|uniref:RHS repeat-associated core domain-containing protein n=1 Tax=Serratia proteamaculans TaxID=28151 RepID=UPI00142EADCE|nr:RHS repeat-associated core domain-containing protein [Serratia proteamaculans]